MANRYKGIKKSVIDAKVRAAKAAKIERMIELHDYVFCEDCGVNASSTAIDCSHNIPVDKCQKDPNYPLEMAWDISNLQMLCRDCHKKRDGLDLRFDTHMTEIAIS